MYRPGGNVKENSPLESESVDVPAPRPWGIAVTFAPAGARLRRVPSNYVMLRSSIVDLVKAFQENRIRNYYDAIQMSHE